MLNERWSAEEDNFLHENYHKLGAIACSEKLYRGYDATKKRARRLNISKSGSEKWELWEENILKDHYGKMPHAEIITKYLPHRNRIAIEHKVSRLGLTEDYFKYQYDSINYKHNINHEFFSTPNLLNSYVAGFLAGDGNVFIDGRHTLSIHLARKDKSYLERIVEFLTDAQVKDGIQKPNKLVAKEREDSKIQINSKRMIADLLNNFCIEPKKTFNEKPPTHLLFENACAFIIGNLDADGSIMRHKNVQKRYGKIYTYPDYLVIKWLGSVSFLNWIWQILNTIEDISGTSVREAKPIHELTIAGKRAETIYNYLYHVDVPKMERKWDNPAMTQMFLI